MKNRRLKKSVVYSLYALSFIALIGSVYLLELVSAPKSFVDDSVYVNGIILENDVPVVSTKNLIIKPYLSSDVKIGRYFYSYLDSPEMQQNSLIYYDGVYIPNSGVDYKSDKVFDVVSILSGVVTKITENNLLGKIVEITHNNNLISVYQSLGEVNVMEGEQVIQGQIIGKSGTSNISIDMGNHLHFEIIHNGTNVNPESYYDKKLEEL